MAHRRGRARGSIFSYSIRVLVDAGFGYVSIIGNDLDLFFLSVGRKARPGGCYSCNAETMS